MPAPAIFVFIQEGCPACHEFMPRFEFARRGSPGTTVGVYDLAKDPAAAEFARKLGIRATPTAVVMTSGGRLHRHVGAVSPTECTRMFMEAR